MVNVFDPEKKRTRGFETTGPEAALEVRVFGGGEQPLKRRKCIAECLRTNLSDQHFPNYTRRNPAVSNSFSATDMAGRKRGKTAVYRVRKAAGQLVGSPAAAV